VPEAVSSNLMETMETVMLAHPADWQKYYHGNAEQQRLLRVYSYSDRIRYYWRVPEVEAAVARLMQNLQQTGIPETILSQYRPRQYDEIRAGKLRSDPKVIVISNVRTVLASYSEACLGLNPVAN
jgi:D-tagatose-1,6-bisphosphate aldolase subunit GatZ/KbaZ